LVHLLGKHLAVDCGCLHLGLVGAVVAEELFRKLQYVTFLIELDGASAAVA
jgi:uncharacterized membrane protein YeaQ/YmgE (transglycosylase-associated protein family)